jgi:hypothetical protein
MSALTDKLKKQAQALIPRFYREYKGESDWWHSVRVDGKDYDLNFLTHDPDGTGGFTPKLRNAVKVVAYKDGIDGKFIRLGYFNGRIKFGNRMYKSRLKINPPKLFQSGGYAVVTTYTDGQIDIGTPHSTKAQAEKAALYAQRMASAESGRSPYKIEVLPVTSVVKNPPLSSHGSSMRTKRTHGLSLNEMRALYKLVKQGNGMAIAYARKKLEVPRSESKVQLLAVVDHHIRDLAGR